MRFVFPPVVLTVCIIRIYTTMFNSWFLDVTKGDGNCCILNSMFLLFSFFFFFFCARLTWLYLFGKRPAHVPSSQAINSSRRRTQIYGYAVQVLRWTVLFNAWNAATLYPSHRSDWWRWCHWFWLDHALLEDSDCKMCLFLLFFLTRRCRLRVYWKYADVLLCDCTDVNRKWEKNIKKHATTKPSRSSRQEPGSLSESAMCCVFI